MQSKIRKENLRKVKESLRLSTTELAERIGKSQPYVSALFSESKSFGPKTARNIEKCLKLPEYFLDVGGDIQVAAFEKVRRIPILSYVQAGIFTTIGDETYDEWIESSSNLSDKAFALRICGDSMSPRFSEGDLVIVDPTRCPRAGSLVVAVTEGVGGIFETTFKQYAIIGIDKEGREVFELRPFNNLYPTIKSHEREIKIIGVVVESRVRHEP